MHNCVSWPVIAASLALAMAGGRAAAQTHEYPAEEGVLRVTPFAGAGVQLEYLGTVVHVDPWSRGDYSNALPADVILITDTPADHLDPQLVAGLRRPHTTVVLPTTPEAARDEGGASRVRAVADPVIMLNGDRRVFPGMGRSDVEVEAVAMYDLIPGEPFHARGEGNGYVVTLGGIRTYLAGVTECTPEMLAVTDIDILFIPMNLPNGRMPPDVAADCARRLAPRVVYPYHYRERPIDAFVDGLADTLIDVRLHDFYPPAQ